MRGQLREFLKKPNNMNNLPKLDKWDNAVIFYVKQDQNSTIEGVRKIWAERCGLDLEDVTSECLVDHFSPIVIQLLIARGTYDFHVAEFIRDCAPNNAWKYGMNKRDLYESDESVKYFNRVLAVICSRLRLTETKYLIGFREYFEQRKANCVVV